MKFKLMVLASFLGMFSSMSWGMEVGEDPTRTEEEIEVGSAVVGTLDELQRQLDQKKVELKLLDDQLELLPVHEAQQEELQDPSRAARLAAIPAKTEEEELTQSLLEYHRAEPQREESEQEIARLTLLQEQRSIVLQNIVALEGQIKQLQETQEIIEEVTPGGPPSVPTPSTQPVQPVAQPGIMPTPSQPLTPSEPELPLTPGWSTQRKVGTGVAALAAITAAIIGGYLYKNAPAWRKERVKKALQEFDKEITDLSDADLAFLMAASYAKFNPARLARAFFFRKAMAAMPIDQELSKDVWPVLYFLYYEKKPSQKEKRELKKIYREGRELARAAAEKKKIAAESLAE